MTLRVVATPLAVPRVAPRAGVPRRVADGVLAAVLPGPGRDRLAAGAVLAVTTGQQPGLFTGPLFTIHKALSCLALAERLERERGLPVVPVFWVAGDDHDFREANHTAFIDRAGDAVRLVLRERSADAPQWPLSREPCGPEIAAAIGRLREETPESSFKEEALAWLEASYRPDRSLADACAEALNALLGPRGLAVFRAYAAPAKAVAAPTILAALERTLDDGLTPVMVEGREGRDRLRRDDGAWVTRRSGERFARGDLERIAAAEPERLSPNVLLRPVVEAVLFPTVAYVAGPAELGYLPEAAPLYAVAGDGVAPQTPVPRWSGLIVETRVERVLRKHGVELAELAAPGGVEARLVREALPTGLSDALRQARGHLEEDYGRLSGQATAVDPTLERSALSARNAALARLDRLERKLVASLRRRSDTVTGQIARARAALYPGGKPQERVLTLASFLVRYGPGLLDDLAVEVARGMGAS
jgi:uncharacterized protein YllA (UPF0747 family)